MSKIFDCIIIGAGPAGLAAGNVFTELGIDFLIIEKGDYLYKRTEKNPKDIVTGIGGGGLYSDGKVSFYPSGTNLYKLRFDLLRLSYVRLSQFFQEFDISIPPFDEQWLIPKTKVHSTDIEQKQYESIVLSQEELFKVGFYLYDNVGRDRFIIHHDVENIEVSNNIHNIHCLANNGKKTVYKARNIIYSAGKFGSLQLEKIVKDLEFTFKQFEFGIRIETAPQSFDYANYQQTDLKLLIKDSQTDGLEFRTFCFCRNGYIIHGQFENLHSYNGVSNKPQYSKTNFGINLRIQDEQVFKSFQEDLELLKLSSGIVCEKIADFMAKKNITWSDKIFNHFQECLKRHFPKVVDSDAEVTGPSFEYFGYYPELNSELKVKDRNMWIAGDATGDFRGLMPALTSGYLAALAVEEKIRKDRSSLYDLVRLKVSPTHKIKTIFTAQSKKFFYCKDVICEFVFNEGGIPMNPFQVFGYFLGDRVDRALVRNGNNELISRCDELWVFGSIADGVLFEISRAFQLKMPIRFFTIGTHSSEIEEITDVTKLVFEPEVHSQIGKENLIKFVTQCYSEDIKPRTQLKLSFE